MVRPSVVTTLKRLPTRLARCMAASAMPTTGPRASSRAAFEARVAEAGDDVAVDAFALAGGDLLQQAGHGQRLVVVALDRGRAHRGADRDDLGARPRDGARAGTDLLGHAPAWCWD